MGTQRSTAKPRHRSAGYSLPKTPVRHHSSIHVQRVSCFLLKLESKNYPTYISQNSAFRKSVEMEHFQSALMITTSENNFFTSAISLAFKYFVNITANIRHSPSKTSISIYFRGISLLPKQHDVLCCRLGISDRMTSAFRSAATTDYSWANSI